MLIAVRIALRLIIPIVGYSLILVGFQDLGRASNIFSPKSQSAYWLEVYFGMTGIIGGASLIALAMYAPLSWF